MSSSVLRSIASRHCLARSPAVRRLATTPPAPAKSSNLPFYFGGAGVAGLAAYVYISRSQSSASATPAAKAQEKSPLDPNEFIDFKLKKVEPYNHNTAKFVFELPDNQASLLPVASLVVVKSSDPEALKGPNGKPVIRPYTPISPSDAPGELTLLVKKYPKGLASVHIHDLQPGDTLAMKGPIQKFPYQINEFEEIGLIGGGSGITPLYQILAHALPDKSNKTKFTLLFANVSQADILMREELDALKQQYPDKFNVVYVVDKGSKDWKGETGYINKDIVMKYIPSADKHEKVKVFICGPPGQVASLAGKKEGMKQGALGGVLKELGYTEDQVFKF